jgi:hypothetical protein
MKYKVTFHDRVTTTVVEAENENQAAAKAQKANKKGLLVIKVEKKEL